MKLSIVGFIFARGGSKGVPRKNIRPFAGKPLIAHAIEIAKSSRYIDRVIVSTDDKEIASVAEAFGAEVPFLRPSELAQDNSPEWLSWQHAIKVLKNDLNSPGLDVFVSIPTTAPLRSVEDVDSCIEKLIESDADIIITVKKSDRSPYFNMVKMDKNGYADIVIRQEKGINRRQDAPQVYDITTVAYAARPDYILNSSSLFEGKVKVLEVPAERALDIDTNLDFIIGEFLFNKQHS